MAQPAKSGSFSKRFSLFSDIFSSSNDEDVRASVVGRIVQQTSPAQSPVPSRSGSTQISVPALEPVRSTTSSAEHEAEEEGALWFETARNGVSWGQVVVLSYVALGIAGGFIFWSKNSFSLVDSIFMTVSAITGSSLSTVLLQDSSFPSLIVINVLAFISSPTWSDLIFIVIWYRKVSTLLKDTSAQSSGNAIEDLSSAKAIHALRLEKGATLFAGVFLLVYTFAIVLLCTIVGGLYLTFALEESFENKCFGFSCFWVSWFDSVGNFANSGFTLNPAGFIVYANHPFLPLLMCFCMSSGIMFRTTYMSLCLSVVRRFAPDTLRIYCDHFFQQSVILRTLFDLNAPQLASAVYNIFITLCCTIFFFFAESHQRSSLAGTETWYNQLVMFLFLAMSVRWSGTTVMDLSKIGAGSKLIMFCVLGLLEVPFDKRDEGKTSWDSYLNRFTLGTNSLYLFLPLGWIIIGQIGSSNSFLAFNCMFEVMSAFFNSGVTIPNQDDAYLSSLSYIGSLPDASKIVLLFVMLAGRFRKVSALPQACKEAIASWKASPDSVLDMRMLNQASGVVSLAQVEGHIEPALQDILRLLSTVPVIQSLSQQQQLALCRLVSCEKFCDGDAIIRQGDVGDNAYIVSEGSVNIKKVIKPGDPELSLVTLHTGSFFGELALINNAPRGASVYAVGNTSCIVLSKSTFETIKDSVSSDMKDRELGYARSEIDALGIKIESLKQEISFLRRRKSINGSIDFPSLLNPESIQPSAFKSPAIHNSDVASNVDPPCENMSLPGAAFVTAASPLPVFVNAASRPVVKVRRTLLPLPAPTPR